MRVVLKTVVPSTDDGSCVSSNVWDNDKLSVRISFKGGAVHTFLSPENAEELGLALLGQSDVLRASLHSEVEKENEIN